MEHAGVIFWMSAAILFAFSLFDLIICPHSKVEESFQLQATHDLYYYGIGYGLPYDHLQYPGVVPRTFIGPLILSVLCRVLLFPCSFFKVDINPNFVQFLARFFLLLLNLFGWIRLALTVDRIPVTSPSPLLLKSNTAMTTGSWLLLITACQFHIPYYSSRMLPNTFALVVILQSYSYWLEKKIQTAAILIVFGTVVFRCDLLLLLGSLGLSWLFHRELSILVALKVGTVTGILSLLLTTPLDSLLWQRPVWPEGAVFYFNAVLGKSKEWGLSPWHWYFTSALPKAMLLTIFLVPFSVFRILENLVVIERKLRHLPKSTTTKNDCERDTILIDKQWAHYFSPILGFVVLYSCLGHKEMRFIFPALPILNLAAAVGMSKLTHMAFPPQLSYKDKTYFVSWIGTIGYGFGLMSIGLTLVGSLVFVFISKENYSGGAALRELSSHVQSVILETGGNMSEHLSPHVHIDVAAAMSGVSLFEQRAAQAGTPEVEWMFSKDGFEEGNSVVGQVGGYEQFTHLLSEDQSIVSTSEFTVIHSQQGRPRLDLRKRKIVTEDTIFVLERNGWQG